MRFRFWLALAAVIAATFASGSRPGEAEVPHSSDFKVVDGTWLWQGKPNNSTTAHAIYHKFRKDREGAIEDLKALKAAGFTIVESYWDWKQDLLPSGEYDFSVFDDFVLTCKEIGLPTFVMFSEYEPAWLAEKLGWGHIREDGQKIIRIDDHYVCNPGFKREAERFYKVLLRHLKTRPEVSENILYWNIGGEYKPFVPHRQAQNWDHGYDIYTVNAFRDWMRAKGWSIREIEERWGVSHGTYRSFYDVWPSINLAKTDFRGRPLANWNAARWDWYDFRQEVSTQHFEDVIRWIREEGENRPLIHEYNIIVPGSMPMFLRWSRVGARDGKDGIYLSTGTFDREFDYHTLLFNLSICRGASLPPWQSNEQKGNTAPEWMLKHAWLMNAMGGAGTHFWEWRGNDWGVVDDAGQPSPGYPSAALINAQYEFLGDLYASSKPMPSRIGILSLNEEAFHNPRGRDRETYLIHKTLLDMGYGGELAVLTDDEILFEDISDFALIISPGQARMRESVRIKLDEFTRSGGVLWLTPESATRDEANRQLVIAPGAPLYNTAGLAYAQIDTPVTGTLVSDMLTDPEDQPVASLEVTAEPRTAEPVAFVETGQGRIPAIWRNKAGRGMAYTQVAHTAYLPLQGTPLEEDREALNAYLKSNSGQLPRGIISDALKSVGMSPLARATRLGDARTYPDVMVGVRKAEDGYFAIVIEGDNRRVDVDIHLSAERLGLTGDWSAYDPFSLERRQLKSGAFSTSLTPSEVKIFHIVRSERTGHYMAYYREKNWKAIKASLPPIPAKTLIPPDEIGRVDPGDLASIQPRPHQDKWLPLDLSRHANRSLLDEGQQENAKTFLGGVGVGENDLSSLPTGLQTLLDIPFYIIDSKENENSVLITKTSGRPWLGPLEFPSIPVRSQAQRIHWLWGSGWAPYDLPVGYVRYNYSDGTSVTDNVICSRNISNWWGYSDRSENPTLRRAWSGSTPAASRNYTSVGLYHYAWENPHPEKTIDTIDIVSYGGDACIITVGITAEK